MARLPSLSLRAHLLLPVLLALAPITGVLVHSGMVQRREALRQATALMESQAAGVAEQQQRIVEGLHQLLITLGELPEIRHRDPKACDPIFRRLADLNPHFATLFAADPEGRLFSANTPFTRLSIADRKYFRDALRRRAFASGEFVWSRLTNRPVIHFALPVYGDRQQLLAVLVAGIDLQRLDTVLERLNLPNGATLTLADHEGRILHRSGTSPEPLGESLPPGLVQRLGQRSASGEDLEITPTGRQRIAGSSLFLEGESSPYLLVKVAVPEDAILSGPRKDFRRNMLWLAVIASAAGLAAWMAGERLLVAPIRALGAHMSRLSQGEWGLPSGLAGKANEIGALARSIDRMADTLSQRNQEQEANRATLLASQQLLDLFFTQSMDGFYIATIQPPLAWNDAVDKDAAVEAFLHHMRVEKVNAAMLDQYGATESDFIGKPIRAFYEHDLEGARRMIRDFLETGRSHLETFERKADGTPLWIEGDYRCIYDAEGRITGHFGIQRDVTQRKEAEERLKASEEKFRALFDNTFQFIGLLDTQGTLLEANRSALEFAGCRPEDVVGKPFWETPWWKDSLGEQARLKEAVSEAAQGRLVRFETTNRDAQGEVHVIDFSLKPFRDAGGTIKLLIPEGRDITERRQAEQVLREREQLFRLLFERSGDANLLLDGSLFVDCNEATVRLLGAKSREQILNAHPSELSPEVQPDGRHSFEKADEMIATAFRQGSHRFEWMHKKLDGTAFPVDVMLTAIPWQGKWILHTAWRDLSERHQAEAARRELEIQVQQTQRLESLGVLAGGIAHDFNNLLTALLGNLNLAHLSTPEDSPALPYLESAETTVLRASELTQQMLAYSGKGRFVVKRHDLNRVVHEMTHLLQVSIPKKVNLHYQLSEVLPPLEADSAQIQQVILNLVTNASDAIGNRDGTITIRTETVNLDPDLLAADFPAQGLDPGLYVSLEVADTGTGIPPEIRARIFEPFFTTKPTGRGLGLSAMLGILRGHKAGIQIRSEVGQGTTFRLVFPASPGSVEAAGTLPPQSNVETQGTILLVDDEPMILDMGEAALQGIGCQVWTARNGVEALEVFQRQHSEIDLVLMDLTMPRMDGLEAFSAMHAINPSVPVILSSGFSEQESVSQVLGQGLAGFLSKPYTIQSLRAKVQEALRAREGRS